MVNISGPLIIRGINLFLPRIIKDPRILDSISLMSIFNLIF